jgi:hypothetical protein
MARDCRNQECVNGLTPGVAIQGKGNKDKPILGQTMRWSWVRCTVCNPKPKDPPFKFVQRTPEDIARRAKMASERIEYKPKSEVGARLGKVAAGAGPLPDIRVNGSGNAEMMAKLDKINENMADLLEQIKELRAENKELKIENARLKSGVNGAVATEASSS